MWGSVDLRAAEKLVRVCALLHRSQYRRVAFPSDEDNLEKPFSESIPSSLDWFRLSSRRSILSVSALIPREFRVVSISFEGFAIRQTLLVRSGKWWPWDYVVVSPGDPDEINTPPNRGKSMGILCGLLLFGCFLARKVREGANGSEK